MNPDWHWTGAALAVQLEQQWEQSLREEGLENGGDLSIPHKAHSTTPPTTTYLHCADHPPQVHFGECSAKEGVGLERVPAQVQGLAVHSIPRTVRMCPYRTLIA